MFVSRDRARQLPGWDAEWDIPGPLIDIAIERTIRWSEEDARILTDHAKRLLGQAAVYRFISKEYGAQTRRAVLEKLRDREVDPALVAIWWKQGIAPTAEPELSAFHRGYPELRTEILRARGTSDQQEAAVISLESQVSTALSKLDQSRAQNED